MEEPEVLQVLEVLQVPVVLEGLPVATEVHRVPKDPEGQHEAEEEGLEATAGPQEAPLQEAEEPHPHDDPRGSGRRGPPGRAPEALGQCRTWLPMCDEGHNCLTGARKGLTGAR